MPFAITAFATREAAMEAAAQRIADALANAIAERGQACAALSGGSTPESAYRALATMALDWPKITFALVDERFVPVSDAASNQGMIERALAPAFAQGAKLAPMWSAAESVGQAADQAEALYAPLRIDVALMGMGADGHTASWFSGAEELQAEPGRTVIAIRAPQAQGSAERLTLTRGAVRRAGRVILLITGKEKRARLEQAARGGDAPVSALLAPGVPPIEVIWAP